jgi:predicted O-methyltransferase YrrM
MRRLIRPLLDRVPYLKDLRRQVSNQGAFPPGHFYSPIPARDEAFAYIDSRQCPLADLPGIDMHADQQRALLDEYAGLYTELPFPEKPRSDSRYYYDNGWFSYSDAIFLYCFLRKHKPKRIVEVGSGFSSAVMLDTMERFFTERADTTFIDPYPERLESLLREGDKRKARVLATKVQEVSLALFSALEAGDLLFIDSSHVVKIGSDLQWLMFDVLPMLAPGVFVHFHDVFYPFEYPRQWIGEGRYWNENYFLRAFLSYNDEWSIYFFNDYVARMFGDFIKTAMPLCVRNTGGGLYIKRRLS